MEIVNIYREIGNTLHDLGAYRVVLISAKASSKNSPEKMNLEIAVDGSIDVAHASKLCMEKWDNLQITLLDLNDYSDITLMQEVIEDGIKL